jgi:hypothetical protein
MIERVECPNPAYNKIIEAGIDKVLFRKRESLTDITHVNCFPDDIDKVFAKAERVLSKKGKLTQEREVARNIILFRNAVGSEEGEDYDAMEKLSLKYPSILAYIALGNDVCRFRHLGFPTRKSLEESIVSFCMGEERSLSSFLRSGRTWRNGKFKNEIFRNEHGDLHVSQADVSGRYYKEQTLFGEEEVFDSMLVNPPSGGFGAYQDWSGFLLSLLRYAQALGKEKMPEIVNWREIAEKDGIGGNWADGHCDFGFSWITERKLLREGEDMSGFDTIFIPNGYGSDRTATIPFFTKDRRLVYRRENGEKLVEYNEKDLSEALVANYCYFARDRLLMCKIMEKFVEETK